MAPTFQHSQDEIAKLVKRFLTNRAAYHAPAYKEAHVRQEFIDPMFAALGWDVNNTQGAAPDYREVTFEGSLDVGGQNRAPDYVFRVGRERKFFVEAKKPGVSIKTDTQPAYQLRSYAWSAKLPLSLLTDFEKFATQFHALDYCTI
jgi:predicted type IV restriction endonuclease